MKACPRSPLCDHCCKRSAFQLGTLRAHLSHWTLFTLDKVSVERSRRRSISEQPTKCIQMTSFWWRLKRFLYLYAKSARPSKRQGMRERNRTVHTGARVA